MAGKPEKPPNSAYSLFSRIMLKSGDTKHWNEPPKNRMQEIAKEWKLVTPEEKQKYADQVQHVSNLFITKQDSNSVQLSLKVLN